MLFPTASFGLFFLGVFALAWLLRGSNGDMLDGAAWRCEGGALANGEGGADIAPAMLAAGGGMEWLGCCGPTPLRPKRAFKSIFALATGTPRKGKSSRPGRRAQTKASLTAGYSYNEGP